MKRNFYFLWAALSALLMSGCAQKFGYFTTEGHNAMRSGHLSAAQEFYTGALISAQREFATDETFFTAYYNLGRVKRFLCKDDEAESLLRKSIEYGDKVQDEAFKKEEAVKATFELARLYYDQERYGEVVPLMAKGLAIVEGMDVEREHPTAFAHVLGQYADALGKTNRQSEAKIIEGKANTLRARPDVEREWALMLIEFERECKGASR